MTYRFVVMGVGGRSDPAGFIAGGIVPLAEALTLDEAAEYLRISKKSIYRIRSRVVPAFKDGKYSRDRLAELGAWIARRALERGGQAK